MKKIVLLSACCIAALQFSFAQGVCIDVLASSGGSDANATHKVGWTIGETVSESIIGSSNDVTQGFHQTKFCFKTSIQKITGTTLTGLNLFPNPFRESVTIDMTQCEGNNFQLFITDISGKTITTKDFTLASGEDRKQNIDLSSISEALYFLTISNTNSTHTFKITKIN